MILKKESVLKDCLLVIFEMTRIVDILYAIYS